ncbi:MAG: hypothetical protein WBH31_13390, partial [Promethearchaeia archaeon]
DVITGITSHQLDPYKKIEAERWLLGELMNIKELSRLNLMCDLRKSKNAFIMLKLLIENSKLGTIFFIDDFEKIISIPKVIEEDDDEGEIFDRSWLYGKKPLPNEYATKKVLEKILKLQRIEDLRIIIVLRADNSLEQVKRKISRLEEPLKLEVLEPLYLENFIEKDTFEFYLQNMENYLQNFKYSTFYEDYPDSSFPLNKKILSSIFHKAKGNPREITKQLIKIFNEIVFTHENLEISLKKYENSNQD